jgi:hypothetical protein
VVGDVQPGVPLRAQAVESVPEELALLDRERSLELQPRLQLERSFRIELVRKIDDGALETAHLLFFQGNATALTERDLQRRRLVQGGADRLDQRRYVEGARE